MNLKHKTADSTDVEKRKLMRMRAFSALAIGVHNFPVGLATFMSALCDPALGVSIAVAAAIHNISEGSAVYAPIYYAILRSIFSETTFCVVFAAVAGITVYISL